MCYAVEIGEGEKSVTIVKTLRGLVTPISVSETLETS